MQTLRGVVRSITILAIAACVIAYGTTFAHADGFGRVDCGNDPTAAQCTVNVVEITDPKSASGGGSGLACSIGGIQVECYNGFGWLGAGGCYYGKSQGNGFLPASDYYKTCVDPVTGDTTASLIVTLVQPPGTLLALARQAVSHLAIPQPAIAASPALGSPQVVQLPVWWWVQPGSWRSVTATASLPGISITATATPRTITWYAGDGSQTVCAGAGTPWSEDDPPQAASPTCGHTYRSTSQNQPKKKFTVRAVATWDVTWAGAGSSGAEPAQTTQETAAVEVTELRALVRG